MKKSSARSRLRAARCLESAPSGVPASLWLKPDASQQVCESWIRAQAIEPWLNFEHTNKRISRVVGLFQPSDCLIFIPQPSINICEYIWPNISEFRLLLL